MTALSLLTALVAVLACLGNFIKIGPFPITLTLCPIIIGAALYGPSAGALLGFVFGVVTLITGILAWDGGAYMMLVNANAFWAVLLCLSKGTAAGWISGLVYRAAAGRKIVRRAFPSENVKNSEASSVDSETGKESAGEADLSGGSKLAVVLAGIACPVTNTGIFLLVTLLVFRDTLAAWAGGTDLLIYAFTGLTGVNFLVELTVNMLLASAVTMIVQYAAKRKS